LNAPHSKFVGGRSTRFVLSLEVLTCVAKIGRTCRSVPFNTDPWSRVRDHFGDQNVLLTFAIAGSAVIAVSARDLKDGEQLVVAVRPHRP
jgi:hypothetical protein